MNEPIQKPQLQKTGVAGKSLQSHCPEPVLRWQRGQPPPEQCLQKSLNPSSPALSGHCFIHSRASGEGAIFFRSIAAVSPAE